MHNTAAGLILLLAGLNLAMQKKHEDRFEYVH